MANTKVSNQAAPTSFSAQLQIAKTQAHKALQQHPAASRKDPESAAGTTTSGTGAQSIPPSNTNAPLASTQAPNIMPVNNQVVDSGGMAPARSTQGRLQTFSHAQSDTAKTTSGSTLSTNITALSESGRHSAVLHGSVAKLHPQGYRTPLQQSAQQSLMVTPVARSMGPLLPQSVQYDHVINSHQAAIHMADAGLRESVPLHQKARYAPKGVVISSYTKKNNRKTNMQISLDVENKNKTPVGITNKIAALMPQAVVPNAAIQLSQTTAANGFNSPATLTAGGVNLLVTGSAPLVGVANPSVATTTNSSAIQESWNQLAPIDLTQPGWQHVIAGRIRQTQQGSMLQIQVHPHHLGPISMQASNGANGVISVWLQASNPQTQALLQQALPDISQSLSRLGSNASVEVGTNAFGTFGSGAQSHTPNHGRTGESPSRPLPRVPKNPESLVIDSVTSTVKGFESWI
ncbi:flagellar hook-length control protein FliK [Acidithiobacillus ferriphilus]|uniref:flagellar hook-length control protein FliK n=1 Tax=Acidithiobacillus ferriphilus TaxID=1689834 RepID=UPI002DBEC82F|nr:flagellar hook-length control protein FliK [Acidithiobacillus ferriphilus]MEB8476288.1 flagellar hook-length control protein FliK [Acidithiobacillus ferriphilus]